MSVEIPTELEPFVQDVIRRGVCPSADAVVANALRVYRAIDQQRERLKADIEEGLASETISGGVVFAELDRLATQYAAANQ